MEKIQLEKIKNRAPKKYNVNEVFFNSKLETQTIEYLKNQNYLAYEGINKILMIKFDKTYPFGYVLKCDNEIVGFLGTIFSQRKINNKNHIYCNLHTWIVNKSHRLNSYLLLLPVVEKNCLIMTFTPVKSLIGLYQKFGFEKLEMKYKVVSLINLFSLFKKNLLRIEKNLDQIKNKLNEDEWKIYQDHANSSFVKFIVFDINDESNFTLMICTKVKKKFFNVFNILYISNKPFVKKNWQSISKKMLKEFKVYFCGQYFLDKTECTIPDETSLSKNFNRNICVKNLPADMSFDILYSEII